MESNMKMINAAVMTYVTEVVERLSKRYGFASAEALDYLGSAEIHVSLLEKLVRKPNPKKPIPDEICNQWHPQLNGKWKPSDFSRGSNYYATWFCGKQAECGCYHIWNAPIGNRLKRGCPWCCGQKRCQHMMDDIYSLQAKFPYIALQFHPTKNGIITPDQINAFSHVEYWWLCLKTTCVEGCKHEYQMKVSDKIKYDCPLCRVGPKQFCIHNSLRGTHPAVAIYWDMEQNRDEDGAIILPTQITYGSNYVAQWKCQKTCIEGCVHSWAAPISSAVRIRDCDICPFCSGQKICPHNSLSYLYPEIALEWHPTKNVDENGILILANQVFPLSGINAWWICPNPCPFGCVHEYQMIVANRTDKNQKCPFSGCCKTAPKRCCIHTSLNYLYPELASQWHPKNSTTPDKVLPFCNDIAWWKCEQNEETHEWEARVSDRHNSGCPKCSRNKSENETRAIAEQITGKLFPNKRSIFANNRLEIDCYCEELKIGIEQQGYQHYQYFPHFHRNGVIDFEKQQERDQSKRVECLELGIRLIEVSYLLTGTEKVEYLKDKLNEILKI
jgi:hypothetical protein